MVAACSGQIEDVASSAGYDPAGVGGLDLADAGTADAGNTCADAGINAPCTLDGGPGLCLPDGGTELTCEPCDPGITPGCST